METAWYLHAVASVDQAQELYNIGRQRQAFAVSSHIFDLALSVESRWSRAERLAIGFAAAIGYRRGDRDPNAAAILRRLSEDISVDSPLLDHIETVALEAGLGLLGFDTRTLFAWFRTWRRQLDDTARLAGLSDLTSTEFGTTHQVVLGADDLLAFLARGNRARLERARTRLLAAALGQSGPSEPYARWVAAHLLSLTGEAEAGSVWSPDLLPPEVPTAVRDAFTLASPPVLTLWRPQRELLNATPSPFDASVRRMVLSVPTSGGKTLIAQLLTVAHIARETAGVCYIVPTRSLGREVRRAMASRLRVLQKEIGSDLPDFPTLDALLAGGDVEGALRAILTGNGSPPDVEVMTPERLGHLLRHDVESVLARFSMFIFDEAQLIKEAGRGFALESAISFLHYRTRSSYHRIVLMSAALGNAGQIAQWIDSGAPAILHQSDWRGPRRLHAAFSTDAEWSATTAIGGRRGRYPYRLHTPLHGLVRIRLSGGRPVNLRTNDPIGLLVRKTRTPELRQSGPRDDNESDRYYILAVRMIAALGHAGTALIVATTRTSAERIARGLAAELPEQSAVQPLVDFVRSQVGDAHPLVRTLRHGVGFHHAGLPIEVLEALEDAVREDTLPYLTCTSTLTEGVNLPVRTVVIYDETYEGQPEDVRLRGPRLVNAMGRAGRAGKETEGWIVLVRAASPSDSDFDDLSPTAEDLTVTSTLAVGEALEAFASLEQAIRSNEDAIFSQGTKATEDFISFIWFVLAAQEAIGIEPGDVDLDQVIASMLTARQIEEPNLERLYATAHTTRNVYERTEPGARRRWPRTGATIGSARVLDGLAAQVSDAVLSRNDDAGDISSSEVAIELLTELNVVSRVLDLPENKSLWRFRVSPRGAAIGVPPDRLLLRWIGGEGLSSLADQFLAEAPDPSWRIEQLVDTVTSHFEHYLAWMLGALVELVNSMLDEAGVDVHLCPELGAYVRYGVNHPRALGLMVEGLRSRRLAHQVIQQMPDSIDTDAEVREWLSGMTLSEWRARFEASPSEVLDLLDVARVRGRSLLRGLLETGSININLRVAPGEDRDAQGDLSLRRLEGEGNPAPIGVYAGEQLVGVVAPGDQMDISSILDTGLSLILEAAATLDPRSVTITLGPDE